MEKNKYDHLADGVRFQCQGSGKCCVSHGEYGHVYLSLKDRVRFAKYFGMTLGEWTKKYAVKSDGFWALKENETPDCIFLKNKQCQVYEGRPTQCRTWPFWPDVLGVKKWRKDVVSFCPGVGKGKHYTWDEIRKIAEAENKNVASLLAEGAAPKLS